jgi:hypothetical protein
LLLITLSVVAFGSLHVWLAPEPTPPRLPGPIGVQVLDWERRPIPGAVLELFPDQEDPLAVLPAAPSERLIADGGGRARPMIAGQQHLIASAAGWGTGPGFLEMGDPALEIVLGPPVEYTGSVVDANGQPVAGAPIEAYYGTRSAPTLVRAFSDVDGRFVLDGLSSAMAYVNCRVAAPGYALAEVEGLPGREIRIRLNPVDAVRGRVIDNHRQPVAGAIVVVNGLRQLWCATDATGRFRLDHVPARVRGGHTLRVAKEELTHPPCTTVQPGDELEIILSPAQRIEGRVFSRATHRPAERVLVYHQCGPRAPVQATTDASGRWRSTRSAVGRPSRIGSRCSVCS